MLFKAALLNLIADGSVTLAFRHWRRPTVRAGGTLRTAIGVLLIEAVETVRAEDLTEDDARRSGFVSRDALLKSVVPRGEGALYRIAFSRLGDDPREALRLEDCLDDIDLADLTGSLARLDRDRPWTVAVLRLIGLQDGTTAGEIAAAIGLEKPVVKRRIRQLKELGLTESLSSGYRLSPRGRAVLPSLPKRASSGEDG
ncbi:helix-turn-helix domain-containing protein [Rhizobium rhizogenes]|uniref:helix-turn-helix domain-containing protein n=1 Tax=Rhizobium rhizogenes TaxID=359 RepID=UPI002270EF08|nr:helix-turn-helix domain-containing protein [Rhizobium rhizogenes]